MVNFIKRNLLDELKDHLDSKEISLIVGSRQAGKTTIMKELQTILIKDGIKTIYFNLDFEQDKQLFSSQSALIKKLELEFGDNPAVVFIDEIQRKEDAGLFLKGIYDYNLQYKFIVSGSGSLELKEKIHESLAGRKRMFELSTVTFQEFVNFKTEYRYKGKLNDFLDLEKEKARSFLEEYLNFGGYPRVVTEKQIEEKRRIIDEIIKSYIEKDIVFLLKVERADAYSLLLRLLASMTGKITNYSVIASNAGISVPTLKHYLWYAEKTFVLDRVLPYFKNAKKEITKAPIYYFNDIGFRNYLLGLFGNMNDMSNDLGFVFQNFIYNILKEKIKFTDKTLHFWRTLDKAEVDFVIESGNKLIPIEVKYASCEKSSMKKSLRSFINKYNPEKAFVINIYSRNEIKVKNTKVSFVPFYDLFKMQEFQS